MKPYIEPVRPCGIDVPFESPPLSGSSDVYHRLQDALNALARGDAEEATNQLEVLVRQAPGYAPAFALLAQLHEIRERWEDALTAWRSAALLAPAAPAVREGLRRASQARTLRSPFIALEEAPPLSDSAETHDLESPGTRFEDGSEESEAFDAAGLHADHPEVSADSQSETPEEPAGFTGVVPDEEPERTEERGSGTLSGDADWYGHPAQPGEVERPPEDDRDAGADAFTGFDHTVDPFVEDELQPKAGEVETAGEPPDSEAADGEPTTSEPDSVTATEPTPAKDARPEWSSWQEVSLPPAPKPPPADPSRPEWGEAGNLDLDALIAQLSSHSRAVPPLDADPTPAPDLDDDFDDLVSETLARIYARQGEHAEAARVYEQLARQYPDEAERFHREADEQRSRLR